MFCFYRADSNSYRIIHVKKNAEMWNTVMRDHLKESPFCDGFVSWHMPSEQIRGFGCREKAKCDKCTYKSDMFNLYEESNCGTKGGRKSAKINEAIQVGLTQTPIAGEGLRKICLSANIPAPSSTCLQKSANKVCDKIKSINEADMKRRRQRLIQVNKLRGLENPNEINVQCDGMYNNNIYSGIGKTPFQPATQTVYSVAENETNNHDIIAIATKNKLCSHRNHLKSDKSHKCFSEECSANIPFEKSIGDEFSWAKECFEDLQEDGITVSFVTTDPDSSAYTAAETLNENVQHSIDVRHLGENHRRNNKNNDKLLKIMPGRTKAIRTKVRNNFAIDIAERCQAEFTQAFESNAGDYLKVQNKLSYTVDAIIRCYQGKHNLCRKHSFVCNGGTKNWIKRSTFLSDSFVIEISKENTQILRQCVEYRLGPKSLRKTKLNANTQKVESFNRTLRRSLPKNVTFSRNFPGRSHASAYSSNNGPGDCILGLCKAIDCEIPEGGKVSKSLKSMQTRDKNSKLKKKSIVSKTQRADKRKKIYKLYELHQEKIDYVKNKLLKADREVKKPKAADHNYAKGVQNKNIRVRK